MFYIEFQTISDDGRHVLSQLEQHHTFRECTARLAATGFIPEDSTQRKLHRIWSNGYTRAYVFNTNEAPEELTKEKRIRIRSVLYEYEHLNF